MEYFIFIALVSMISIPIAIYIFSDYLTHTDTLSKLSPKRLLKQKYKVIHRSSDNRFFFVVKSMGSHLAIPNLSAANKSILSNLSMREWTFNNPFFILNINSIYVNDEYNINKYAFETIDEAKRFKEEYLKMLKRLQNEMAESKKVKEIS